jgi:glycosyltransferase A (GT-A) superfamily protein (DUF2064 family)
MKKRNLLILFSKWPESETSKSRVAKDIGKDCAKDFSFACLDDLIKKIKDLKKMDLIIIPNTSKEASFFEKRYDLSSLSLESLGISWNNPKSQIFQEIFNHFLKDYLNVGLIPMDIPHIDIELIKKGYGSLETFNQVFGPEENGGVYFMGLTEVSKNTFKNVRWSTKYSFYDLMENSTLSASLDKSFDLNNFEDLRRLDSSMLSSCPHLTRFIKSLILEKYMEREVISI